MVERDVIAALEAFHSKDQWCRSLSATFISLIPKKFGAVKIKDYWPISLVGCLYKLLSKILAIRLKAMLSCKNAFCPRLADHWLFLMAYECINARLKFGKAWVVCKVNLEKTYDCVNWSFLDIVLQKIGFG